MGGFRSAVLRFWFILIVSAAQRQCRGAKSLKIVSPLRALTIWDPETNAVAAVASPRKAFLPIFRARLQAEAEARGELQAKAATLDQEILAKAGNDWATSAARSQRGRRRLEELLVEAASDRAAARATAGLPTTSPPSARTDEHQFVGLIRPNHASGKPIQWYARAKPANAKWSVRLVHMDPAAILTDLFRQRRVDVFAKYRNMGKRNDSETNAPIIQGEYSVRERSFRNLWNFSPKHFFTDPSGMYWRERRLRPGLYTDGTIVYEASYRYRDGRNGMHRLSTLQNFMASKGIPQKQKDTIATRIQHGTPDIVLE